MVEWARLETHFRTRNLPKRLGFTLAKEVLTSQGLLKISSLPRARFPSATQENAKLLWVKGRPKDGLLRYPGLHRAALLVSERSEVLRRCAPDSILPSLDWLWEQVQRGLQLGFV